MSEPDPLDAVEEALFRAARRERPPSAALERTQNAVVALHRRRRFQRSVLTLGGVVALAAGAALVLRSGPGPESIQAERIVPKHSVSSVAAVPSVSAEAESAASAVASGSADILGLAPSVSATTLEEEQAMLGRARSELTAGNAESALSLLDQYDRVSGGHLTAEATLLRIEALSNSGRTALAAKLARRFVDSDPNSPLAERARAYLPNRNGGAQ